jgi:2-amino-4-hydroxy-6-hydroxymethyldihydropteridine diphosphokinase
LGSNIGKAQENIKKAIQEINQVKGVSVGKKASLYLTKAWGLTDQNDFINTVVAINTSLNALELLDVFQNIEKTMGRIRLEKWGPRIIDIDILLYANDVVDQPRLSVPHPYILERNFVLVPLLELDSDITIPNKGKLRDLIDTAAINKDIIKI